MLDGKTDRGGEQGGTNGLKGKHKVSKSHKYSNGINNDGKVEWRISVKQRRPKQQEKKDD